MIVICPECCRDLIEVSEDIYRCRCGFEAEQLTIMEDSSMEILSKRTADAVRIMEQLEQLQHEEVIFLHGRAFIVSPASPNKVERVTKKQILD